MDIDPAGNRFHDVIASSEALQAILGRPNERGAAKVIDTLDIRCRRFIARSPFVMVGSSGAAGNIDISPTGAQLGFVQVTRIAR